MKHIRMPVVESDAEVRVGSQHKRAEGPLLVGMRTCDCAQVLREDVLAAADDAITDFTA
jgi:hypothetical protein